MSRRVVAVLPVLGLVVVTSLGGCSLLNRPPSPDDTARSLAVGLAAPELTRLMAELNQLSASLRHLSEQTTANPSSLLVGHPAPRPGPGESARP